MDCDVCIIGSGAGGGPVALTLAEAGHSVIVLEKGPWFTEQDFFKDEIACCRRNTYSRNLQEEFHVVEEYDRDKGWDSRPTYDSGWDFWNGNMVGGSSNLMSGFFHRLKPEDFRLLSEFGAIEGANVADWPISYDDLEPYYEKVEHEVGISGRVVDHPNLEPRSTKDYPFQATAEHPIASWFDKTCQQEGVHSIPVARAILPHQVNDRGGCQYSGYCGSYGCSSGAKGSSRAALLNRAVASGNCAIRPNSHVYRLDSDASGRIVSANYYNENGSAEIVRAEVFVVACQAVETSRLLLLSRGQRHANGLANNHGQVGKNLLFSSGGAGTGSFLYDKLDPDKAAALKIRGPFANRALQDWYFIDNDEMGRVKGGTIEFLFRHPNPIGRANAQKWGNDGLLWGKPLKKKIKSFFNDARYLRFEVFGDWLPNDDCSVSLDESHKDKWDSPVARIKIGIHPHNLKVGRYLARKGYRMLKAMGAENASWGISGKPPVNLIAGGCRFGTDPRRSVLDRNCRAHDVDNLYVTDGSFMPTGGSVPYTWTIYANAFRVADKILSERGGVRQSSVMKSSATFMQ
jgi:choline dehydrogenase-like flavoprotein